MIQQDFELQSSPVSSTKSTNIFAVEDDQSDASDVGYTTAPTPLSSQNNADSSDLEYHEGMTLPIEVLESFTPEFENTRTVDAHVDHIFSPSTQSVVMKVSFDLNGEHKTFILKLFDRRGAKGFRTENGLKLDSWTPQFEDAYQHHLATDHDHNFKCDAINFINQHLQEPFFGAHELTTTEDDDEEDEYFREALFALGCKYMMDREVEVYNALTPIQGAVVPIMYSTIIYTPPNALANRNIGGLDEDLDDNTELFSSIYGVLLEYAEGVQLCDLFSSTIPQMEHQRIGDMAIDAVNRISALNVLNCDVSTRNAIVRKNPYENDYQVVVYDFGIARVRYDCESDETWLELKWNLMEQDKMGLELVDVANYEYDCIKPYDDDELAKGNFQMLQQQEYYKQKFFNSWKQVAY